MDELSFSPAGVGHSSAFAGTLYAMDVSGSFHTSECQGGVERRQLKLKGI
jgi:hypothetical protein